MVFYAYYDSLRFVRTESTSNMTGVIEVPLGTKVLSLTRGKRERIDIIIRFRLVYLVGCMCMC
jgi:hypothetical protein